MEITGYKYTTEAEAKLARKQCADHYGLPFSPDSDIAAINQNIMNYYRIS